jgi:hypothetical protein
VGSFWIGLFGAALSGPISVVVARFWQANRDEDEIGPEFGSDTEPPLVVVRSVAFPLDPDSGPDLGPPTQPLPIPSGVADLASSGHHPRAHRAHR